MKNGEEGAGSGRPSPGPAAQEHPLLGYFDSAEQTEPTFNPGPDVPCVICYKPLCAPLKTISLMKPGSRRSYFYRAHKFCYERLSPVDLSNLEWSMLNPKARSAPNPSSGEGPSPSTPDRTPDVTHPHPREGRP